MGGMHGLLPFFLVLFRSKKYACKSDDAATGMAKKGACLG